MKVHLCCKDLLVVFHGPRDTGILETGYWKVLWCIFETKGIALGGATNRGFELVFINLHVKTTPISTCIMVFMRRALSVRIACA